MNYELFLWFKEIFCVISLLTSSGTNSLTRADWSLLRASEMQRPEETCSLWLKAQTSSREKEHLQSAGFRESHVCCYYWVRLLVHCREGLRQLLVKAWGQPHELATNHERQMLPETKSDLLAGVWGVLQWQKAVCGRASGSQWRTLCFVEVGLGCRKINWMLLVALRWSI